MRTLAKGIVSGEVSNGATWIEQFEISENNLPITGATTSTWKFTFKPVGSDTVSLTLTSGTEITVTQGDISTIFAIDCPQATLDSMVGDYHADFAQKDASNNIIHWLHGTVTFNDENLGF